MIPLEYVTSLHDTMFAILNGVSIDDIAMLFGLVVMIGCISAAWWSTGGKS